MNERITFDRYNLSKVKVYSFLLNNFFPKKTKSIKKFFKINNLIYKKNFYPPVKRLKDTLFSKNLININHKMSLPYF